MLVDNVYSNYPNRCLVFTSKQKMSRQVLQEFSNEISKDSLMLHLSKLTAPEMEGRGVGLKGLDLARDYIAKEFKKIGLKPFKPLNEKNYFDTFMTSKYETYVLPEDMKFMNKKGNIQFKDSETLVETSNILGMIKGKKYPDNYLFITAHYDHLGKTKEGIVFPGADDNASSVSAMLEIAKHMKLQDTNDKSVVFVALSGEEHFKVGSDDLAKKLKLKGLTEKIEIINIEMLAAKKDGFLEYWKEKQSLTKNIVSSIKETMKITGNKFLAHNGDPGSDAFKFNFHNLPAVTVCWSYKKGKAHPFLHTDKDTIENVNPNILTKAAKTVAEICYMMSNTAPNRLKLLPTPSKNNEKYLRGLSEKIVA